MGLTVLDAGILVAVVDPTDAHHAASVAALRRVRAHADTLIVPASAYAECLVWPLRVGPGAAHRMEAFIDDLPAIVAPADRAVARLGAELRARYGPTVRLPDALVIATALALGADRILTTDAGWPRLDVVVEVVGD